MRQENSCTRSCDLPLWAYNRTHSTHSLMKGNEMRRVSETFPVESPSPQTWAALADHALALGREDEALALIEEAFAAWDRKHSRQFAEAA